EAEFVGYGASGRNGGWLSSELAGSRSNYARGPAGQEGVNHLANALAQSVDEVIGICEREGIEADIVKNGVIYAARSKAQLVRMKESIAEDYSDSHTVELSASELRDRVNVAGALGGVFNPECARVQPAKLVRGLAKVVRELGVMIYEGTRVEAIEPGVASTPLGNVRAGHVLRCLEGYTAGIAGKRREWLPMNSAMVVTEPLRAEHWAEIGWTGRELLGDFASAYFYAQRTADDRIAIGGRGIPYRFGSRTDVNGQTQEWTIASLRSILDGAFPALRDVPLAHAWCGVLGVPRDWCASVGVDPHTGLGWAGGYVGSGLTATNLAGRTLRDLVLRRDTELTALPWTGRSVRAWEPEPLRWLGVRAMYGLYREADRREAKGLDRPSRFARIGDRISGR
ncbi:MAG: FAD-binding oxidoreductase, partial [Aeromicrobium sp.]